jgi:hypothetical protein
MSLSELLNCIWKTSDEFQLFFRLDKTKAGLRKVRSSIFLGLSIVDRFPASLVSFSTGGGVKVFDG